MDNSMKTQNPAIELASLHDTTNGLIIWTGLNWDFRFFETENILTDSCVNLD